MNYKAMEQKLFADGCTIEFEYVTNMNIRIRYVRTLTGKEYRMIYTRNENNAFIIHSIVEAKQ